MIQQERFIGGGTIKELASALERMNADRIFLVTGRRSFSASGADTATASALQLRRVEHFSGFSDNPKLEDVQQGVARFRSGVFDTVVAVGGGSVLDMAKLVNVLAHQEAAEADIIRGRSPVRASGLPLIAIPTTAGSGSEATHFAVVYIGQVKYSVASPSMLPRVAIVDPELTFSLPPEATAVTGLDAFAQAVESYWSIHSTDESKRFSREAITLALAHLPAAVHNPTATARKAMSLAAHLAGRAIDITRTTGPHALSYPLTSYYGVPHGQAVGLTLGQFFVYNSEVTERDVADPRGAAYVREAVGDLVRLMGCRDAAEARARVAAFMRELGLETRLGALGIPRVDLVDVLVSNVNAERMANNPRALGSIELSALVQAAY